MEMMVAKRNMTLGNVSTTIEEKLKNPPAPNASHMTKVSFIRGIEAECAKDMAKVGMGKTKSWFNEKTK